MESVLTTGFLEPTVSPAQVQRRVWDVLVIGAGPAGSLAARQLARRGLATLLVDRARFPRHKVCGSCVSAAALKELDEAGLGHLAGRLRAPVLDQFSLHTSRANLSVKIPAGAAISRSAFDAALVQEAICRGAEFLPQRTAHLDSIDHGLRAVYLKGAEQLLRARARLVLVADGLGGRVLAGERGFGNAPQRRSRIGAGTICPDAPREYVPGTIYMACGRGGYVGLVRIETGGIDIAAAFDTDFVRASGGPAGAATRVLDEAGLPVLTDLHAQIWHGTPWLTRRPVRVAAERLFVLGDAAGYVEPFTGEGITWALASARAVIEPAMEAVDRWTPDLSDAWELRHRAAIVERQRPCRWLARGLRHPWMVRAAVSTLRRWPGVADQIAAYIHRPLTKV